MIASMEMITKLQKKDIRLIGKFVEVYCAGRHSPVKRLPFGLPAGLGERRLCPECTEFMKYTITRRMMCPFEAEKPTCKHCKIHCFVPQQRERIREIMAYSGRKLIMCGRLDYIWHYFF
jgi:hypothetical protein